MDNWENIVLSDNMRYYLFTEGTRTEPEYFRGFQKWIAKDPYYENLITVIPCGRSTLQVLKEAQRYARDYDLNRGIISLIYDKDDFSDQDFNAVTEKVSVLNQENPDLQYRAYWSNPCFELWLLLHFCFYQSDNRRTDFSHALSKEFQKRGLGHYRKNRTDLMEIMSVHGNAKNAMKYAEMLRERNKDKTPADSVPCTQVDLLVRELAQYLPDEMKKYYLDEGER